MKKWLDNQPIEYQDQIKNTSLSIVNLYREKYKKEPPFMVATDTNQKKEYPLDFHFNCPFLGDNKCNVYEARPFTCRAYAYGSLDGVRYKGCNYFFEQFKGATKLTDIRKVLNMNSFRDFAKKVDKLLIGERVTGPIPVWFAQSHEDTLNKVQQAISKKQSSTI